MAEFKIEKFTAPISEGWTKMTSKFSKKKDVAATVEAEVEEVKKGCADCFKCAPKK